MAIIGPSGSGKSTLARALVGAWQPAGGRVRLDGASLDQWSAEQLGLHVGYLPQDVELLSGTVAENVSRLEDNTDSEAVISAARAAGVHDMILNLREGYQTQIGESGAVLSAGQRQRLALARALYRDPFFVVLDEPNSNLDQEGDKALMTAILGVRKRGGIVIVVSHRPSALEVLDHVLFMTDGRPKAFGPRDEVLAKHFPNLVSPAVLAQKGQSGVAASKMPAPLSTAVPAQMVQPIAPTNSAPPSQAALAPTGHQSASVGTVATLLSPAVSVQREQSSTPTNAGPARHSPMEQSNTPVNTEPTLLTPAIMAQKGQSSDLARTVPPPHSPAVFAQRGTSSLRPTLGLHSLPQRDSPALRSTLNQLPLHQPLSRVRDSPTVWQSLCQLRFHPMSSLKASNQVLRLAVSLERDGDL